MIGVNIKGDVDALIRDLDLVEEQGRAIASRALNRAAQRAETVAVRHAAEVLGLKQSVIRWRYDQDGNRTERRRWSRRSARKDLLEVSWFMTNYKGNVGTVPVILANGVKQTKQGVSTSKAVYLSAFITSARKQRGNRQVFRRKGRARYPIEVLRIDLDATVDDGFLQGIANASDEFVKEFLRLWRAGIR